MISELWRRDAAKVLLGCVLLGVATWIWNWGWIPWLGALVVGGLALGTLVFGELRHTSVPRWLGMLALVTLLVVGLGVAAVRWPTWLPHPGEEITYSMTGPVVHLDADRAVRLGWSDRDHTSRALVAREFRTDTDAWRAPYDEVLGDAGDIIVITRDDDVVAVDVRTGEPAWELTPGGSGFDEVRVLSEDRMLLVDRGRQVRVWLVAVSSGEVLWRGVGEAVRAAPGRTSTDFVQVSLEAPATYTLRSGETGEVVRQLTVPEAPRVVDDALLTETHLVLRVAPGKDADPDEWVGVPLADDDREWSIDDLGPLADDGVLLDPELRRVEFSTGEVTPISLPHGYTIGDDLGGGWYLVYGVEDQRGVWQLGEDPAPVTGSRPTCEAVYDEGTLALAVSTDDAIGDDVTVLEVVHRGQVRSIQLGADGYTCPQLANGRLVYGTSGQTYLADVDDLF